MSTVDIICIIFYMHCVKKEVCYVKPLIRYQSDKGICLFMILILVDNLVSPTYFDQ